MSNQQVMYMAKYKVNCKDAGELVSEYIDDELSPSQNFAFEKHLLLCPNCKSMVNDFQVIKDCAKQLSAKPIPTDVSKRLRLRIAEEASKSLTTKRTLTRIK